jgi:hypothetical protein
MKKIRVPKKDDVAGVLGHKGTFQVLSVDSRNRVVDLRSLEKVTRARRGVRGGSLDIALVSATAKKIFEQVAPGYRVEASIDHDSHTQNAMIHGRSNQSGAYML